jgi:hypothetical protein
MTSSSPDIVSYFGLRNAIGWIGLIMPFAVRSIGRFVEEIEDPGSISAYYYTGTRDIFVATLVLVGALLACYRSARPFDGYVAMVGGIAAAGVGLFPMNIKIASEILLKKPGFDTTSCYINHGPLGFHFVFVTLFFFAVCYLVLFSFPANTPVRPSQEKMRRNQIYKFCGVVMVASCFSIGLMTLTGADQSIYWPETVAVVAFGIAWLVKGQTVLKDKNN